MPSEAAASPRPERRHGRGGRSRKQVLSNCISCFKGSVAGLADVLTVMCVCEGRLRMCGEGQGRPGQGHTHEGRKSARVICRKAVVSQLPSRLAARVAVRLLLLLPPLFS